MNPVHTLPIYFFTIHFNIILPSIYGLDDLGSRIRFPAGAGNFSLHHRVQNGAGAHPPSYPMGTRGLSLGVKRQGREADHLPPSGAEVKECVELYLHSPNTPSWSGAQFKKARGQLYLYLHLTSPLCLGLPSGLFPSVFPTKIFYTVLIPPKGQHPSATGHKFQLLSYTSHPHNLSRIHINVILSASRSSSWLLPKGFPTKIIYAFLVSPRP
jgi:hypothetical protein